MNPPPQKKNPTKNKHDMDIFLQLINTLSEYFRIFYFFFTSNLEIK